MKNRKGLTVAEVCIVVAILAVLIIAAWTFYHRAQSNADTSAMEMITAIINGLVKDIYLDQNPNQFPPTEVMPLGLQGWASPASLVSVEELLELLNRYCRSVNDILLNPEAKFLCRYDGGKGLFSLGAPGTVSEPEEPTPLCFSVDCDDRDACTMDSCNPATGCVHTPITCDDGNVCNGIEACNPHSGCSSETPLDCTDQNACTTDSCDPATGCIHTALNCDDNNQCTADSCDPASGCQHTDIVCPFSDGGCASYTCYPSTGCIGTEWCRYDLDQHDGIIGTGDFAIFAGCFGKAYKCDPPTYRTGKDACCASNFDESPDGFVGPGDFGGFAGCFGAEKCSECTTC